MLEKHRLTYLEHLGIDNYMPTYQLPGAKPSPAIAIEKLSSVVPIVQDVKEIQVAPIVEVISAPTETPSAIAEVLVQPQAESVQKVTPDIEAVADVIKTKGRNIQFSLSVWRVRDDLLVIDSREAATALPTDKLLFNILQSIGYGLAQLPRADIIKWPLFDHAADEGGSDENEARAMVQAFISAQASKASLKYLLLLGADAIDFALSASDVVSSGEKATDHSQLMGKTLITQWQSTAVLAPSLADMLREPSKKRLTWQALKAAFYNTNA